MPSSLITPYTDFALQPDETFYIYRFDKNFAQTLRVPLNFNSEMFLKEVISDLEKDCIKYKKEKNRK
jgi:hypothetical protein